MDLAPYGHHDNLHDVLGLFRPRSGLQHQSLDTGPKMHEQRLECIAITIAGDIRHQEHKSIRLRYRIFFDFFHPPSCLHYQIPNDLYHITGKRVDWITSRENKTGLFSGRPQSVVGDGNGRM